MKKSPTIFTPTFILLCTSTVLFMASFGMIIPELPGYLTEMGAGDLLGYIIGLFTLGAFVSRFFSGRIADNAGRKVVMIIGTVVSAISGFAYILINWIHNSVNTDLETGMLGIWLFLALRVFHGLSTGFRPTGSTALLTDIVPISRRGEALGYLGIAGNTGMAGGPAIGSWLAVEWGYESMFITSSLLGVVALLFTLKLPETLPNSRPVKLSDFNVFKGGNIEKAAWPAAVSLLPVAIAFGVFLTITPDFVSDLGYKYKGVFSTIIVVSSILMRFIAGKASDKYGRKPVLALGGVLLFLGMGVLAISTDPITAAIGGVIYGLSIGINMPTIFAWTSDLAPKGKIAIALGTMLMSLEIGIGLGAMVSGTLYSNNPLWLPWLFSICSVLGGVMALVLGVSWYRKKNGYKLTFDS